MPFCCIIRSSYLENTDDFDTRMHNNITSENFVVATELNIHNHSAVIVVRRLLPDSSKWNLTNEELAPDWLTYDKPYIFLEVIGKNYKVVDNKGAIGDCLFR